MKWVKLKNSVLFPLLPSFLWLPNAECSPYLPRGLFLRFIFLTISEITKCIPMQMKKIKTENERAEIHFFLILSVWLAIWLVNVCCVCCCGACVVDVLLPMIFGPSFFFSSLKSWDIHSNEKQTQKTKLYDLFVCACTVSSRIWMYLLLMKIHLAGNTTCMCV